MPARLRRAPLDQRPDITDVGVMAELLEALGCTVTRRANTSCAIVVPEASRPATRSPPRTSLRRCARRSSCSVRCSRAAARRTWRLPGGDDFGQRPINFHTDGLSAMGATFRNDRSVDPRARSRARVSRATRITLEYPSHTATDNLMMACVLAEGRSVIDNAAREPEVEDLGRQLIAMGARIEGLGTSRLTIDGVAELAPPSHRGRDRPRRLGDVPGRQGSSPAVRCACSTRAPSTWRCCCERSSRMGGHVDIDGRGHRRCADRRA